MAIHQFEKRMAEADKPEIHQRVGEILERDLDAVRVDRANAADDKRGVDFWAFLRGGNRQGVDLKLRRADWGDLYVELVSRASEGTPGWTVDVKKVTDYVLFLWPRRHLLLPYPQLRAAVRRNEASYRERFGTRWSKSYSETADWRTENVGIPEGVLFSDMFGISLPGLAVSLPRLCPSCGDDHPVGNTCAGGWAPDEARRRGLGAEDRVRVPATTRKGLPGGAVLATAEGSNARPLSATFPATGDGPLNVARRTP